MILFISYTDAYIEVRKDLVSRGDCGSERVKRVEVPGASKEHFLPQRPDRQPNDEFRTEQLNYVRCAIAESWMMCQLTMVLYIYIYICMYIYLVSALPRHIQLLFLFTFLQIANGGMCFR